MGKTVEYILVEKRLRCLESRGVAMVCYRCEQAFNVGDRIVSKRNRHASRRYHKACWESMFIDA